MNLNSFFSQPCHSPILRRATIMLVALAWSSLGFCGEIDDAAKNGGYVKNWVWAYDNVVVCYVDINSVVYGEPLVYEGKSYDTIVYWTKEVFSHPFDDKGGQIIITKTQTTTSRITYLQPYENGPTKERSAIALKHLRVDTYDLSGKLVSSDPDIKQKYSFQVQGEDNKLAIKYAKKGEYNYPPPSP